jgi:hypothetical protein
MKQNVVHFMYKYVFIIPLIFSLIFLFSPNNELQSSGHCYHCIYDGMYLRCQGGYIAGGLSCIDYPCTLYGDCGGSGGGGREEPPYMY